MASKIIVMMMALLALAAFDGVRGEGTSVCYNGVIGNSNYIANEYMCMSCTVGSERMEQAQGKTFCGYGGCDSK